MHSLFCRASGQPPSFRAEPTDGVRALSCDKPVSDLIDLGDDLNRGKGVSLFYARRGIAHGASVRIINRSLRLAIKKGPVVSGALVLELLEAAAATTGNSRRRTPSSPP